MNTLSDLETVYRNEKEVERNRTFFSHVKTETEALFSLLDVWEKKATQLAQEKRISIFPQQVTATTDNMQALIMHSYYKDVRKRRYMEIQQACQYIFSQCIEENNDDKGIN